ncbi:hypothetical protein Moror_9677 [Moniliophthora roreri MCA 2997]|uniref:DUF7587 domain-containing protein n=2 Tax=Moniliophthora roreri TaxID=221103 RepID=V2WIN7_MONRO|nr:hypothetical protein Moror_9677 [Moniliophthora roreri MCA 2997]
MAPGSQHPSTPSRSSSTTTSQYRSTPGSQSLSTSGHRNPFIRSQGLDTPSRGHSTPSRNPPSSVPLAPPFNGPLLFRVIEGHNPAAENSQECEPLMDLTEAELGPYMVKHLEDWGKGTPFRSGTLALLWALWEALRRSDFDNGRRANRVEILIIDRRGMPDDMIHVLSERRIKKIPAFQRSEKPVRSWALHAREVLFQGGIPDESIIARVRWSEIRDYLPRFFGLDAKLQKGYSYRFEDCRKWCRVHGAEATRAEIENFIEEVFRPVLSTAFKNVVLVDGYVYNLQKHLSSHLLEDDLEELSSQIGRL